MKGYGRDRTYWKSVLGILEILIVVNLILFELKKIIFSILSFY